MSSSKIERLLKAEKRQKITEKRKNAPKGGTLAGELKSLQTSKFYEKKKHAKK